jgi:predicted Ser/Thr protein kinase/Ca2+-binding EF-hand superfamily protein
MVSIVGNLQSLFQKVDLNGDGAIDFSEWLYLTYLLVESASYRDICPSATDASAVKRAFLFLRRAYTAFDADQNMRLDKDEAKAFMTTYLGVVPDNFEGVFDRVCNPVKKTIDYVRFLSLLYEIVAKDGVYIGKVSAAGSDSSASVAKAPPAQPTANPFDESSTTSSAPPPRMDDLRRSEIQLGAEIGSGGFSTVYKAIVRGHPVAVKILKGDVTEEVREEFDSEVAILVMLDHVNVVRLVGSISERDQLCIVTELCSNGSPFDLLHRKRKRLCLKDLARLALELAEGMRHLHDSSLMHRDLKSLNILLDESYTVKVADFGLSKVLRAGVNMHSLGVGTPQWTAPEQLESQKYSTPADVYSYGCVLFEMTHNLIPFAGLDGVQVAMAAIRGERPTISSRCPEFFAGLMRDCWQKDQNLRPTFEDIVERIKRFQTTIARK